VYRFTENIYIKSAGFKEEFSRQTE